jgi:hypothetical protein
MFNAGFASANPGTGLNAEPDGLSLLAMGDRVHFRSISREKFDAMANA